ncbi:MAG TPA: hypothetical protein VFG50_11470 [Rhodothermales bacterium]|nr:hypothetical protein [Rhodothermales bacterium]
MDLRRFSIEQLIRISIQYGIVTDYTMSSRRIRLFQHHEQILNANPEEARFFLQGLIRGYTTSLANRIGESGSE